MKIFKSFIFGLMAAATLGGFVSCQDDIDAPEPIAPVAENLDKVNTTIFDFKKEYWQDDQNYCKQVGTKPDGEHIYIKGRVISSDESGNVFKSIVIQDETAALAFSVNAYNLFLDHRVGQEVVVDLTGMYVGKYNNLMQMGWPDEYQDGLQTTFMSPEFFKAHVENNGMPDPSKVIVHQLDAISDIPNGTDGLIEWQSQLVRCNNVTFVPKANPNEASELVTTFGIYKTNMNQGLLLAGQELTLRVSGYADFVNEKMPTDPCDATFLLSYFGTGWQFMLMNTSDIENVGNPTLPKGTKENPWTVADAISEISEGATPQGWTAGYIVGTVAQSVTEVTSNTDIEWGADATLASTVVIAPTADCTEISQCIIVPLPVGSTMRNLVALRDHPENLGKLLTVYGTLDHVFGSYGITGNTGTGGEFMLEGVEVPDEPLPGQGDGTEASPYSCAQVIAMNPSSTSASPEGGSQVWITGYIVGTMPKEGGTYLDKTNFGVPTDGQASNIVIAPTADCTDASLCVGIQLPTETVAPGVRKALNLTDNPGNLGAKVSLFGDVMKYCGGPGLKNTSKYTIDGGTTPPTPPTPGGEGEGTEASPFACSQVIALNPTSTTASPDGGKDIWVDGYIVGYMPSNPSTLLSNTVFTAPADIKTNLVIGPTPDCKDASKCVGIQLPTSNNIRADLNLQDNPGNLGKKVKIHGDVMKYCGGPGIKNVKGYVLGEGGETPTPPVTGTIFEETFEGGSLGNFTATVETSGSWTGWRANTRTPLCAIANSYVNNVNEAATAWLVSPEISLAGVTSATLSLEQAFGFHFPTKQDSFCTVNVREKGGEWQQLTLTNFPAKGTGNWTADFALNTMSLNAFAGKTIEIGFKYVNDGKQSIAWEIKNVKVTK